MSSARNGPAKAPAADADVGPGMPEAPATDDIRGWRLEALRRLYLATTIIVPPALVYVVFVTRRPEGLAPFMACTRPLLAAGNRLLRDGRWFRVGAFGLLLFFAGLGSINAATNGLLPNTTLIFALVTLLGCLLLGPSASWAFMTVTAAVLLAVGAAFHQGLLPVPDVQEHLAPSRFGNWVRVAFMYALLTGILASTFAFLIRRLEAGLRASTQALALRRQAEDRYRGIVETATDAILEVDGEGRILFANPATEAIFGYAAAELVGRPVSLLVPEAFGKKPEDGLARRAAPGVREVDWRQASFPARTKAGKPIEVAISLGESRAGDRRAFTAIVRDVTERVRLADRLRQSQKMEAVGQLAGGVAHDFNNALTVILSYADRIARRLGPEHPLAREAREVLRAAEHSAGLTRRLLAFSRRQLLRPAILDLAAVVADLDGMLRRVIGENIELVTVRGPGPARVHADRGQIEQAILNLAVNARDAMPRGGTLTFETGEVELKPGGALEVAAPPGRHVVLAVRDTGTGMDAETRSHLFEPFFTTKEPGKGTGLGLATVYGIVKQSGGAIAVETAPGEGTCFRILLPARDAPGAADASAAPPAAAPAGGSETILVVEDDRDVHALVHDILRERGYRVLVARDGEEALGIAGRQGGDLRLVVTDVVMPKMSGPDLVRRLLEGGRALRVLYMSGYADAQGQGLGAGGAGHLVKPFAADALLRAVREVLDGPPITLRPA